jgi:hypothetical protein
LIELAAVGLVIEEAYWIYVLALFFARMAFLEAAYDFYALVPSP